MPDSVQPVLNKVQTEAILRAISADRFETYLKAAGHDPSRALRLYLWNAQLGEAFHLPIQAVEVGLRNCINTALTNTYGKDWWRNSDLEAILDEDRRGDLSVVLRRIRNRKLVLYTGQVVAGLSFGFWVGILDGRYNPPIWGKQLRVAFPDFPKERGRKSLYKAVGTVATLRNRISHHEPLIGLDILADFSNLMTLLEWICPSKAIWLRPHCRVAEIVRLRP
jgi:hypothetical protein